MAPNGESRDVEGQMDPFKGTDPFQKFPNELLLDILALLPSTAVRKARISSRCFANAKLDPTFWRSRFDQPHEFSHVDVSRLSIDQKDSASVIDYRKLYERMIRAEGPPFRGWQNRKRISSLCHQLCSVLFQPQTPAQPAHDDTLAAGDSLSCPIGKPATTASIDLRGWTAKNVTAYFKSLRHSHYLIGLLFEGSLGNVELGVCNKNDARSISLRPQETIQAIEIGLKERGIVALALTIVSGHSGIRTQSFGQPYHDTSSDHPPMYGRLTPNDGLSVAGIELKFATNHVAVSIALLETQATILDLDKTSLRGLWYPSLPPVGMEASEPLGCIDDTQRDYYFGHTSFATTLDDTKHLTRIDVVFNPSTSHIRDLHYYFDDRNPNLGAEKEGQCYPVPIYGSSGERLLGMEIIWSDANGAVGCNLITSQRPKITLCSGDILASDLQTQRLESPPGSFMTGVFSQTNLSNIPEECLPSYGILFKRDDKVAFDETSTCGEESADTRVFDDHMNVWTGESKPPAEYYVGQSIGCQSACGFTDWADLPKPIKSITSYTDKLDTWPVASVAKSVSGLRILYAGGKSTMLGTGREVLEQIRLDETERIADIVIIEGTESRLIEHITFRTNQGQNLNMETVAVSSQLTTTTSLDADEVAGLTWTWDTQACKPGAFCLSPLHLPSLKSPGEAPSPQILYPSILWTHSLPVSIYPRPIPAKEDNYLPFTTILADSRIVSIEVYFNSFLQGLTLTLADNTSRTIGNLVASSSKLALHRDELVVALITYERVQTTLRTALPGSVLCIEGLQLAVTNTQTKETRLSPYFGARQAFGPFQNEQRGLWGAKWGGSAQWAEVFPQRRRVLQFDAPREKLRGFYMEASGTHVRRLGALVEQSVVEPLTERSALEDERMSASQLLALDNGDELTGGPNGIPWLGNPPLESSVVEPTEKEVEGTYCMWCLLPPTVAKVIVYRHSSWGNIVVVGVEFVSRDGGSKNSLLGHRSLYMDNSVEYDVGEDECVCGLEQIFVGKESHEQRLEDIKVTVASSHESAAEPILGCYAFVGEFINGVGILRRS